MARCVVLHKATNSEHCRQGIKCIKKAQEVINTAGNSKSDGLKIYHTRSGSRICARMQIGAINKLEAALSKRRLSTPTFRAALSKFISINIDL